jgi:hypothetical protein
MECNNIFNAHDPITVGEDLNGLRVICKTCKHQYVIRKNFNITPENRQYSKIFKRDIIQPRENLFYKIYPDYLKK